MKEYIIVDKQLIAINLLIKAVELALNRDSYSNEEEEKILKAVYLLNKDYYAKK